MKGVVLKVLVFLSAAFVWSSANAKELRIGVHRGSEH